MIMENIFRNEKKKKERKGKREKEGNLYQQA